jgi:hypothetical protein
MSDDGILGLYMKALDLWGGEAQVGMVIEEIGELLEALGGLMKSINQYNRGRVELTKILEEVVDVEIMMEQLTLVLGMTEGNMNDLLDTKDRIRDEKIERLRERVQATISRLAEQSRDNSG